MKRLLLESYYFLKNNFRSIFIITGPFIFLMAALSVAHELNQESQLFSVMYVAVFMVAHAYTFCRLIKYMAAVVTGGTRDLSVTLNECFRLSILYLVYGTAIVLGLIALVIPGLYLIAKYAFADFEFVLNKRSTFQSMSESWSITSGVVLTLILGGIAINAPLVILEVLIALLEPSNSIAYFVSIGFSEVLSLTGLIFSSIFHFRVYTKVLEEREAND
ncbi:hypothetical protein [Vibrio neptunius]|uniref:hypothetical protein n=1 Tax=Vibrio neptunius TaxID=170651 RepID=UPI0019D20055|nr:hypothetical protein [Vibrio neptunius]MBN3572334.1 hypothetical protein [Vibrio neptunius]